MPVVKFWYSPGACSLASHILLNETGVDYEAIVVHVKHGAPEELRKLNPKMRIPVLSIDGQVITENPAIMTAISQLSPEKQLMGRTNLEIVRTYEWLNYLSGTLHGQGFGGLFRAHRFSDDPNTFGSIKAKGRKNVEESFDMIEKDLSGLHAVGNDLTVVDTFLYAFYRWGAQEGIDMQEKYPKLAKLVVNLGKLKSVQIALNVEGVDSYIPAL